MLVDNQSTVRPDRSGRLIPSHEGAWAELFDISTVLLLLRLDRYLINQ